MLPGADPGFSDPHGVTGTGVLRRAASAGQHPDLSMYTLDSPPVLYTRGRLHSTARTCEGTLPPKLGVTSSSE